MKIIENNPTICCRVVVLDVDNTTAYARNYVLNEELGLPMRRYCSSRLSEKVIWSI
jgi:hypothetical protein